MEGPPQNPPPDRGAFRRQARAVALRPADGCRHTRLAPEARPEPT